MIRNIIAQKIAAAWHGGQWSALYQFASSGVYLIENHLRYLQEIETELHPEYLLYPYTLTKRHEKELNSLKKYFVREGERQEVKTKWGFIPGIVTISLMLKKKLQKSYLKKYIPFPTRFKRK